RMSRDLHSSPTRRSSDLSSQFCDQFSISFMRGCNADPLSVNEYSMRTGVSGYTSRLTMPSFSKSFNRSDSTLPLTPMVDSILQKDRKSTRLNSSHVKISY